jgi:glycosyltransferase involved in cell wall biosynthesis
MKGLRLFVNFREVRGAYGGANAFLRALTGALRQRGVWITNNPRERVDLVFLNALSENIDLAFVQRIHERGAPIIHRKVGYRVSGPPEMRAMEDGVVHGDRLQVEFSPYVAHTIFQSGYSRDVFLTSGFEGPYDVIPNGVDESVFNLDVRRGFLHRVGRRSFWAPGLPLRVAISTWSTDPNKGFAEYVRVDGELVGRDDLEVVLIGRVPLDVRFREIKVVAPQPPVRLAAQLKRAHVLLQLARYETCSNALIEGINCGLPAIYLDSGSNAELAAEYGVEYRGDFVEAAARVQERYEDVLQRIPDNPYRISNVVERYLGLFGRVLDDRA